MGGSERNFPMQGELVYADSKLVIARGNLPGTLIVCGVLDSRNVDPVVNALREELRAEYKCRSNPSGTRSVSQLHLDLSGLEFEDTGAIKALVRVAGSAGVGQRLVLSGIPPLLQRVMVLVGWADTPGLVISANSSEGPGRPKD